MAVYKSVMFVLFRKGAQLAFGETISLDMYGVFYQLLSTGVVWLGILLLIFTSLLPDIVFMLIGRQFYPSETQNMQVTMKGACFCSRLERFLSLPAPAWDDTRFASEDATRALCIAGCHFPFLSVSRYHCWSLCL